MIFQDLTGQVFYKLTILKYVGKGNCGQSRWLCRCECGTKKVIFAHHMKSGNVKSCGCLAKGEPRRIASTKHGWANTPEWNSYHAAKKRCNPKYKDKYPDWAGRGIEFRFNSFEEFIKEIGPRPEPKFAYSLERPNNNGHYEPGNVSWATKKTQARNRRCNNCELFKARILELENELKGINASRLSIQRSSGCPRISE
jgi:hypothetical protein